MSNNISNIYIMNNKYKINKIFALLNTHYIFNDEIIIEVEHYEEADKIISLLDPDLNIFRIKKFQLQKIDGYQDNYMLKIMDNGSGQLINIHPQNHKELYLNFIK